jgi:hypothetical protein
MGHPTYKYTVVKKGGLKNIHYQFNDGFYYANVSVVSTDGRKTVEKCRGNVSRIKIIIKLAMNVFQPPPPFFTTVNM